MPDRPATGALVVRVWVEPHPTAPLRAVVTWTVGTGSEEPTTQTAAAVDEVCELVRTWLLSILDEPVTPE